MGNWFPFGTLRILELWMKYTYNLGPYQIIRWIGHMIKRNPCERLACVIFKNLLNGSQTCTHNYNPTSSTNPYDGIMNVVNHRRNHLIRNQYYHSILNIGKPMNDDIGPQGISTILLMWMDTLKSKNERSHSTKRK